MYQYDHENDSPRERYGIERGVAIHEFAHILGLGDGYVYVNGTQSRVRATPLVSDPSDIMRQLDGGSGRSYSITNLHISYAMAYMKHGTKLDWETSNLTPFKPNRSVELTYYNELSMYIQNEVNKSDYSWIETIDSEDEQIRAYNNFKMEIAHKAMIEYVKTHEIGANPNLFKREVFYNLK